LVPEELEVYLFWMEKEDPQLGLLYEALTVHLNKKNRTQLANLVGIIGALAIEEIQEDKTCTYLFEKLRSRQILTDFNATKLIKLIKDSNIKELNEILVCLEKYQQDVPKKILNEQKMEGRKNTKEDRSIRGRDYPGRYDPNEVPQITMDQFVDDSFDEEDWIKLLTNLDNLLNNQVHLLKPKLNHIIKEYAWLAVPSERAISNCLNRIRAKDPKELKDFYNALIYGNQKRAQNEINASVFKDIFTLY